MSKQLYKFLLINIGLFIVLVIVFFITGFLAGYGSNNNYEAASWRLYFGFVVAHILINLLFLYWYKFLTLQSILLTSLEIFVLYGILAWYYK